MKAKEITGTIELENGQKVKFVLSYNNNQRFGNTRENLGAAVDICNAMDEGILREELWVE